MGLTPVAAGQRVTAALLNGLPVTLSQLATGSVASSVAETVIGTVTIPANDPTVGQGYMLRVFGSADDVLTPTLHLRLRLTSAAGTLISDFGTQTCRTATNMQFIVDCPLYFTAAGAAGAFYNFGEMREEFVTAAAVEHDSGSIGVAADTTAPVVIVITAVWGTSSASNICRTLAGALTRI